MNDPKESMEKIAVEDLQNLVGELRMMARGLLSGERKNHSFTPTGLAMSALRRAKLKNQDWEEVRWENRAHFFSCVAEAMRHSLVDHARRRSAKGRGNLVYLPPDESIFRNLAQDADEQPDRYLHLEEAMEKLRLTENRLATVVSHFYYLGHSIHEIATILDISEKTVDRDLNRGRVLLKKFLTRDDLR